MRAVMKRCKIISFCILSALMVCFMPAEKTQAQHPDPPLSSVVLFGMPVVKEIWRGNTFRLNECFRNYLNAIPAKSFLLTAKGPSGPEDTQEYRRQNLREQMVVMMGEQIRAQAEAFARAVPLYAEWEGMSENPLDEANFADNWLWKHPGTPIAAFVYLFKAHRLRAGFEAAKAGREKDLCPLLAVKYKEAIEKALSFDNPLISCIARDMENQPYVYLEGYGRP
ncbi:MAG TPA: hypothetical protein PK927_08960 [Smithellaceae bacterium]|nr:hypothetical protein [Smithellaceae bacterium]